MWIFEIIRALLAVMFALLMLAFLISTGLIIFAILLAVPITLLMAL